MDDLDLSSIMVQPDVEPEVKPTRAPKGEKAAPAKKTKTQAAVEESPQRAGIISRLKLHFETFDKKLKHLKPKDIDTLTDEELAKLRKDMDAVLGARTNVEGMAMIVPHVLKQIEDLAAKCTPLRIQGTHEVFNNPDVLDMLKYTLIESGMGGISSTPQQQLLFALVTAAMGRQFANTFGDPSLEAPKQTQVAAPPKPSHPDTTAPSPGPIFTVPADKYAGL